MEKQPPLDRKDKLRLSNQLVQSEGWIWFKEELEQAVRLRKPTINGKVDDFTQGVIAGLEWALALPERTYENNTRFFDRLREKVNGL